MVHFYLKFSHTHSNLKWIWFAPLLTNRNYIHAFIFKWASLSFMYCFGQWLNVNLVTGHLRWTFHGAEHWNVRIKQDCQDDPVGLLLTTFTRFKNSIASNGSCVSLQIIKDEQLLKTFLYAKVFFANQREVSMGFCFTISIGERYPSLSKVFETGLLLWLY